MSELKIRLFGRFSIETGEQNMGGFRAPKVQELFSYLLLFRDHAQPREALCEHLWENQPPGQSKKYLRQTLWRLQSALKGAANSSEPEVLADDNWIQINPSVLYWLDAARFEQAFKLVSGKHSRDLTAANFKAVQSALDLYKGDLLDGWYQDWCLFERERYQVMYLMLLDKLVEYCEAHGDYDLGLHYAAEILRQDHAYERAHRHVMRLYFKTGDRTQAIRQYERCLSALQIELNVEPSAQTRELYKQICSGDSVPLLAGTAGRTTALPEMLNRLERFSDELKGIQVRIKKEITELENSLHGNK